ncbi:hypothetical protein DFH28DRAFT_238396 [Melampsora americana]|nr:hypothetical protein DFH28DRAFT_238396 [Melampsora americana]
MAQCFLSLNQIVLSIYSGTIFFACLIFIIYEITSPLQNTYIVFSSLSASSVLFPFSLSMLLTITIYHHFSLNFLYTLHIEASSLFTPQFKLCVHEGTASYSSWAPSASKIAKYDLGRIQGLVGQRGF